MTQMRGDDKKQLPPKQGFKLTSDQLATPPKRLAGKMPDLKTGGFDGPRPWGGQKIAFEPVADVADADKKFAARATEVIETARTQKRNRKAEIEKRKESDIKGVKRIATLVQALRPDGPSIPENSPDAWAWQFELFGKLKANQIKLQRPLWPMAMHIVLMNDDDVIKLSKNLLRKFHDDIGLFGGWNWEVLEKQFQAAGLKVIKGKSGHEIRTRDDHPLYKVHWGDDRVEDKPGEEGVLRQKGTADRPTSEARRKEYVRDANNILTRRFQTREINYFHLANMVGLNVDAKADSVGPSNLPPGQRPRGDGKNIGGHAKTFDVNDGAVVNPGNWDGKYEATGEKTADLKSGKPGVRVRPTSPLGADSPMDHNVGASMQVRNGSGPDQPRLSSAATQAPLEGYDEKVIRGNKGERFSETNDNVAAIEYDLALVRKAGVKFVNQHAEESHEFKIAFKRLEEGSTTEKRKALAELDEYIYSARKNREVVIDEVPNTTVTKIKLNGESSIWRESGLETGKWLAWDVASKRIAEYITAQRLHTQHWVSGFADEQDKSKQKAKL